MSNVAASLIESAREFLGLQLWKKCQNDDLIVIDLPGEEPGPLVAAVMGAAGREFGLHLFRGPDLAQEIERAFGRGPDPRAEEVDRDRFMSFTLTRYGEIPAPLRQIYFRAKIHPARREEVPFFGAKEPARQPRELSEEEERTFCCVLRAMIQAERDGTLRPLTYAPGQPLLWLTVAGELHQPELQVGYRPLPKTSTAGERRSPVLIGPAEALGLRTLPRTSQRWVVGLAWVPGSIKGDDRSLYSLLVLDEQQELILAAEILIGRDLQRAAELLLATFEGENQAGRAGLPAGVVFADSELEAAVRPGLESVGIACRCVPGHPAFQQAATSFEQFLDGGADQEAQASPSALDRVPEPDDLDGWKAADRELVGRLIERIIEQDRSNLRSLARYFGSEKSGHDHLQSGQDWQVAGAFCEWLAIDYRPTKKSRTLAERWAAEERTPQAVRHLLEARRRAAPAILRIDRTDVAGTLQVEDVLTGERHLVHDRGLARSARSGWLLPARLIEVGRFHFPVLLGPPLSPHSVELALQHLREEGLELSREGLRRKPHLLGRLWDWSAKQRSRLLQVVNHDGDPIEFHVAAYRVTDADELASALNSREDLRRDSGEGRWIWLDSTGRPLACIDWIGDELLAEVDSARRLERARQWLDPIPGLQPAGVRVRSLDDLHQEGLPLDDRLPRPAVELSESVRQELQELLEQLCMRWLDEPIPLLGGLTPRQACRNEEGRTQVKRMIRSMPWPMSPLNENFDVPRQRLLEELGLI